MGLAWFKEALSAVSDETVRKNVERSMIQAETMDSLLQYQRLQSRRENLKKVLLGVLIRDKVSVEEAEIMAETVCIAEYSREEKGYAESNRKLKEKMDRLGVNHLCEGFSTAAKETFRFHLPVLQW